MESVNNQNQQQPFFQCCEQKYPKDPKQLEINFYDKYPDVDIYQNYKQNDSLQTQQNQFENNQILNKNYEKINSSNNKNDNYYSNSLQQQQQQPLQIQDAKLTDKMQVQESEKQQEIEQQQKQPEELTLEEQIELARPMLNETDFDYEGVIMWLDLAEKYYSEHKDYPVELICRYLWEFVKVFQKMGSALGMAFKDVKEKTVIIREKSKEHNQKYLFKLFEREKELGIQQCNGDNNKKLKVDPQYKKYQSASRHMLRMLRFSQFLREMFNNINQNRDAKISDCIIKAYKASLEKHHSFMIKTGAKTAMGMAPKREKVLGYVVEDKPEDFAYEIIGKLVIHIERIYNGINNYYTENKLLDLP